VYQSDRNATAEEYNKQVRELDAELERLRMQKKTTREQLVLFHFIIFSYPALTFHAHAD
jgi:hypothetical protein